jgi:hypothetical protein
MTFSEWLEERAPTHEDARRLHAFGSHGGGGWPQRSTSFSDFSDAILVHAKDDAERKSLLASLHEEFSEWTWKEHRESRSFVGRLFGAISRNIGAVSLVVFGLVIAAILFWGIFDEAFLQSLAQPQNARALITFLFAFSSIAMFLLVMIALFWMEKDEVEARFGYAKDLLTIVVGILGTILGFYFGSLAGEDAEQVPAPAAEQAE